MSQASSPAVGISLAELVTALAPVHAAAHGATAERIVGWTQDSRAVRPGYVFAARLGGQQNGLAYISDAVAKGARAVVVQRGAPIGAVAVPIVEVDDIRLAVALGAEAAYGYPTRVLSTAAVTGTNGKTTVVWLLGSLLEALGAKPARIGTLGFGFASEQSPGALTTPEADVISGFAAKVASAGATHLVLEASSHALSQARVDGLQLAAAGFTNLSQDHLDYHCDMQRYGEAKARLFTELRPAVSVVNVDDDFGRALAARLSTRSLTVSRTGTADVRAEQVTMGRSGIRCRVSLPSGQVSVTTPLVGEHNLENLLLCLAMLEAMGMDARQAGEALAHVPDVPGRLERCSEPGDDVLVLVDYAHTPDALARSLAATRALTEHRLICVFGCGGDRDAGKRPLMGEAVACAADIAIITNDNPRTERPEEIAAAIESAVAATHTPYRIQLDRAKAIDCAVGMAEPGDVVLIAGKGHEDYQIVGTERRCFDDRVEARRAITERRARQGRQA